MDEGTQGEQQAAATGTDIGTYLKAEVEKMWARIVGIEEAIKQHVTQGDLETVAKNVFAAVDEVSAKVASSAARPALVSSSEAGVFMNGFQTLLKELKGIGLHSSLYVEPKPEEVGSGSERWGAGDWTVAGQNSEGWPVEKGSPDDVTPQRPTNAAGDTLIPHPSTGVAPNA